MSSSEKDLTTFAIKGLETVGGTWTGSFPAPIPILCDRCIEILGTYEGLGQIIAVTRDSIARTIKYEHLKHEIIIKDEEHEDPKYSFNVQGWASAIHDYIQEEANNPKG